MVNMAEKTGAIFPSGFSLLPAPPRFLSQKPSDENVRKYVIRLLGNRWGNFCCYLGVDFSDMQTAVMNNPRNIEEAMFECIKKWLNGSTSKPVTWECLLKALEDAELKEQAKELKKVLATLEDSEYVPLSTTVFPVSQQESMTEVPLMGPNRFIILQPSSNIMKLATEGVYGLQKILSTPENAPIVLEKRLKDKFLTLWATIQSYLLHLRRHDPEKLMAVSSIVYMHCRGLRVKDVPSLSSFGMSDVQDCIAKQSDFLDIRLLKSIVGMLDEGEVTEAFQQYQGCLGQELSHFVVYCKEKGISNIGLLTNNTDIDQSSHSDGLPLRVSVSVEEFYLSYILQLKEFFEDQLGIHLQFEGISVGCLILHFIFSRFLIHELYVFLPSHLPTLKRFNVTALCVPDHFVIDVDKGEFVVLEESTQHQILAKVDILRLQETLTEEMAQLKEDWKESRLSEEKVRSDYLQGRVISLQFKLEEEEKLRMKVSEDQEEAIQKLLKLQKEKEYLVAKKNELETKKKELMDKNNELWAEKEELLDEKNCLSMKNEEMSKKESVMSGVLPEKMMSEVGILLEQESSSLEGLQDKLKILLEEWSKQTESSKQEHPISGKEIQDLQKTMMTQFESVQETIVKNLVEKLGIEEDATLKDELSAVLSKEVRPLRESFKEVYSKVYMPQIEQQKKEAFQLFKEVFDKGQGKMFRSENIDVSKLRSVAMLGMSIPTTNATAVPIGREVFVTGGVTGDCRISQLVQVFNVITGQWKTLPPAPQFNNEAIAIDEKLILIGGRDSTNGETTNMVSTWMVDEEKWVQTIPPMNMKRLRPGVLLVNKLLFVFGGLAEDRSTPLDSIEVLDTERNQWSSGHGLLPQLMASLKIGRYEDTVVLTSAWDTASTSTNKAWKIPVRVLEESVSNPSSQPLQWTPIADTPCYSSSFLINSKQPVMVGGHKGGKETRNIYAFSSDRWDLVGELSEQRIAPAVLTISDSSFLVFGGNADPCNALPSLLSSVELITYSV